jgi:pantetheine-phosphate adenylyltransferase
MPDPLDPRHAVYAGSFDPLTLGHVDIIRRGAGLFSRLTVAIGVNPEKRPLFTLDERLALTRDVLADQPNVEIAGFTGLAVNFVRECGAAVLLRGVRTLTDIEAEFTMSLANRALDPQIETVFLMSSEKFTHISSSLIKQIAQLGDEHSRDRLQKFVPQEIIGPLLRKYHDE